MTPVKWEESTMKENLQDTRHGHLYARLASPRGRLILSMFIFGTIGLVRRYIPLSSAVIALARGVVGTAVLLLVHLAMRKRFNWEAIRRNAFVLVLSGALIGINWILLFEAYRYTSVAVATICYYMAPVFVILASPLLFGERITLKKGICQFASVIGVVLVSGVIGSDVGSLTGVLYGLAAAALYAIIIILNKRMKHIAGEERTIFQMGSCAAAMLVYVLVTEDPGAVTVTAGTGVLLLVAGIVHTGLAYALYFGSIADVPAQSAAILSYIDPVVAVILSAVILREQMTVMTALGAVLVLGGALLSEMSGRQEG